MKVRLDQQVGPCPTQWATGRPSTFTNKTGCDPQSLDWIPTSSLAPGPSPGDRNLARTGVRIPEYIAHKGGLGGHRTGRSLPRTPLGSPARKSHGQSCLDKDQHCRTAIPLRLRAKTPQVVLEGDNRAPKRSPGLPLLTTKDSSYSWCLPRETARSRDMLTQ